MFVGTYCLVVTIHLKVEIRLSNCVEYRMLSLTLRSLRYKILISFSILNIKQNTNTTDLTKLISNKTKKCQLNNITELGQPAYWTHPHLFNSNNETNTSKQEVTPGITKQEFEERRDNYVKYLTNYQMFYFSSRFSKSEKEGLKSKKPADWLTTGYDNLTIDKILKCYEIIEKFIIDSK